MKFLSSIIFLCLAVGCWSFCTSDGKNRFQPWYKLKGYFPHQVSVQFGTSKADYAHVCGGSIISPKWVLTAGHCIFESRLKKAHFVVKAGVVNIKTDKGVIVRVEKKIVHPKYEHDVGPFDIAVLELEEDLPFSKYISAIPLLNDWNIHIGDALLSTWGDIIGGKGTLIPDMLQTTSIPILTKQECNTALRETLPDTNICTGPLDGSVSTTPGDGGSPLIIPGTDGLTARWYQVGVVSWGIGRCGTSRYPSGVFTNVTDYIGWINEQMH